MKLKDILLLTTASLTLWSCSDEMVTDDELEYWVPVEEYASFWIPNQNLFFDSYGSNASIEIYSTNTPWQILGLPNWLTADKTVDDGKYEPIDYYYDYNIVYNNYQNVYFNATANPYANTRIAIFDVVAQADQSLKVPITATQSASEGSMKYLGPRELSAKAQTVTGQFETNYTEVTVETAQYYDFVHNVGYDNATNTLSFDLDENNTDYARTFRIYLVGNGKKWYIDFTQFPPNFSSTLGESMNVALQGGNYGFYVESDVPWTATTYENWISIKPNHGEGTNERERLIITVLPNTTASSRTGFVYLSTDKNTRATLSITQEGLYIDASQTSVTIKNTGECNTIVNIESNVSSWEAYGYDSWLTVLPTKDNGNGNGTLTFTAEENTSAESRFTTVNVGVANVEGLVKQITVEQRPKELDITETSKVFPWYESSQELEIITNKAWEILYDDSDPWLTISSKSGSGDSNVWLTASTNNESTTREIILTILSGSVTKEITVTQQCQFINISSSRNSFGYDGGTIEVYVNSSVGQKYEITDAKAELHKTGNSRAVEVQLVPWLNVTSVEKDGDGMTYTLTADANPSCNMRRAYFVIYPTYDSAKDEYQRGVKLMLSQYGRTISVSTTEVLLLADGGKSDPFVINAAGEYEVTENISWLALSKTADNTYVATATKNNTNSVRTGEITISLKNLPEGETFTYNLSVRQLSANDSYFGAEGYGDDENWNPKANVIRLTK